MIVVEEKFSCVSLWNCDVMLFFSVDYFPIVHNYAPPIQFDEANVQNVLASVQIPMASIQETYANVL